MRALAFTSVLIGIFSISLVLSSSSPLRASTVRDSGSFGGSIPSVPSLCSTYKAQRDTALKSLAQDYKLQVKDANNLKKQQLAAAKTIPDKTERKNAIAAINTAHKAAMLQLKNWQNDLKQQIQAAYVATGCAGQGHNNSNPMRN